MLFHNSRKTDIKLIILHQHYYLSYRKEISFQKCHLHILKRMEDKLFTAYAMVISTSCHIDQKDKILMVPVFPIDSFTGNLVELKKNMVFDFMYIPDNVMSKRYVCFNMMTSYNKKLICGGIENGKIKRIASLNQIGYYFFIIKLSVYLMRKEDPDTLGFRKCLSKAI